MDGYRINILDLRALWNYEELKKEKKRKGKGKGFLIYVWYRSICVVIFKPLPTRDPCGNHYTPVLVLYNK